MAICSITSMLGSRVPEGSWEPAGTTLRGYSQGKGEELCSIASTQPHRPGSRSALPSGVRKGGTSSAEECTVENVYCSLYSTVNKTNHSICRGEEI